MSDQDTLHTLSLVDDQVSDTPPEPETENSGAAVETENGEAPPSVEAGQAEAASLQEQPEGSVHEHSEEREQPEDSGIQNRPREPEPDTGETFRETIAAQAGDEQTQQEEHAQGYSYGQPGYGQNQTQGNPPPWGPNGFNGSAGQGTPPPGWQYNSGMGQQKKKSNNTMAMASLVLGIVSVLLCCCGGFGIILGAIGIVLAILSRGREPMETSAKVGIGLSIGGIVLSIIVLVMAFAAIGNNELYDFYQRGYGNYEDYEDFSHYFDHNGM